MKSNCFIVLAIISFSVIAESNTRAEIKHLSMFVANTECLYERNGVMYSGEDALKHIEKKYEYYEGDVETTEDFIRLSATKSKMSGKSYKIHCDGNSVITSKEWLLSELRSHRASGK